MRRRRTIATGGLVGAMLALAAVAPAGASSGAPANGTRAVFYVGNNWAGTADIIDAKSLERLGRINVVPDRRQRSQEILMNPVRTAYFIGIREFVGEGHDQFADDLYSSRDGRILYVARPSFADVVAIDLRTKKIRWRIPVDGQRSDHMAMSPDGRYLAVSASTANKVHIINTDLGREVGEFESGDSPHENHYTRDGGRIFHASIGLVYTPADQPLFDSTKGERYFQIVDARSLKILRRVDMGEKLEELGHPEMSSAVRPITLSPDERFMYFQVSFFHGFGEYDIARDKVTRLAHLPVPARTRAIARENYILDSAHHGLAINNEGTKLCAAGTMANYTAIVSRETFRYRIPSYGKRPYWSTNSGDGRYCLVSYAGDDEIGVIDWRTEREVARVPVGRHPQRVRNGSIESKALESLAPVSLRMRLLHRRFRAARRGHAFRVPASGWQNASASRRRRPVGTRIRYRLDAGAAVTFRVQRASRRKGRVVGGRCVRRTRRNAGRRRCTRYRTLRGRFVHRGVQGVNRIVFTGRWRGRRLRSGRYRLIARARDRAGNRSRLARARFQIVRR